MDRMGGSFARLAWAYPPAKSFSLNHMVGLAQEHEATCFPFYPHISKVVAVPCCMRSIDSSNWCFFTNFSFVVDQVIYVFVLRKVVNEISLF